MRNFLPVSSRRLGLACVFVLLAIGFYWLCGTAPIAAQHASGQPISQVDTGAATVRSAPGPGWIQQTSGHAVQILFSASALWQAELPTVTPTPTASAASTDTPTLTPPGKNPLVTPSDTPFPLLVTTIHARVFANTPDSCPFALTPSATPYFEQDFPVIAFNPPSGVALGCVAGANHDTRPFTDMVPTPNSYGTPCGAIPMQYPLTGTPTWQAGITPLLAFRTVFTGQFYASDSGYVTFKVWSDDGWILGLGLNTAHPTTTPVQPVYVDGTFVPAPPLTGTPWPTTAWEHDRVVGRFDQGSEGDVYVFVRVYFPEPGYYPFELDYTECHGGTPLTLVVGTTAGDIIHPGPSATPTPFCVASYWCTASSPNVPAAANTLNGVAVYNPNEIWAVGAAGSPTTGPQQSLVQHWNGAAWTVQTGVPDVGPLNSVAKVIQPAYTTVTPRPGLTPTPELWAVGDNGLLHYNNGSWSQDQSGLGGRGIAVADPQDMYAVGSQIQHGNGQAWSGSTPVPGSGMLNGVAVIATKYTPTPIPGAPTSMVPTIFVSKDDWAVGYSSSGLSPLAVHQVRGTAVPGGWSSVAVPTPGDATSAVLNSVDFYDRANVWAVGSYHYYDGPQREGDNTLIEHWDGAAWRIIASPNPGAAYNSLQSVWYSKEGDVWAAGYYSSVSSSSQLYTLLLHWNDTSWDLVSSPQVGESSMLQGIGSESGPFDVVSSNWAVGRTRDSSAGLWATLTEDMTAPTYPGNTISYYETSLMAGDYYNQGCAAAARQQAGIVVLDFGQPTNWGSGGNPQFGTLLIGPGLHAYALDTSGYDIRHLADQFAKGYDDAYTGSNPTKCPAVSGPRQTIYLAISTSNDQGTASALNAAHAATWAKLVDKVANDVSYIIGIVVVAGIDAEPGYASYTQTADWVNSYSLNGHTLCYDFGSTDGYPALAPGEPTPVVPRPWGYSSWSVDELYNIAWGITSQYPLPQIYRSGMARDWYRVKRWSQTQPHPPLFPMTIKGVMSECHSSGCQPPADFSEQPAWQVLWLELNSDQLTQQNILYATDIRCSNGNYAKCDPNAGP